MIRLVTFGNVASRGVKPVLLKRTVDSSPMSTAADPLNGSVNRRVPVFDAMGELPMPLRRSTTTASFLVLSCYLGRWGVRVSDGCTSVKRSRLASDVSSGGPDAGDLVRLVRLLEYILLIAGITNPLLHTFDATAAVRLATR